jgi:hypothetical protein
MREAHVGSQSADPIKFAFRKSGLFWDLGMAKKGRRNSIKSLVFCNNQNSFIAGCRQMAAADLRARAMTSSGVGGFGGWKERQIGVLSLNGLPLFSVLK